MLISEIIAEADVLVPNRVALADKITQLNALNHDFFNVVKIPKIVMFDCVAAQSDYVLDIDVRSKNIDRCMVGMSQHRSLDHDDVNPTQNMYTFDDMSHTLSVYPAPYTNLKGVVRHRRIATTTFVSDVLNVQPDAPQEYHWTFVPALAAYLAHTQDDAIKAANYEAQYKAAWNVASQNYQVGAQS